MDPLVVEQVCTMLENAGIVIRTTDHTDYTDRNALLSV
jgi:hypothetical protein